MTTTADRIAVGVDGSPGARRAPEEALGEAHSRAGDVHARPAGA